MPPYSHVSNWDVINYLKAGRRLEKSEHCPDTIYELMNLCWQWDPQDRPSFSQIIIEIRDRVAKIEKRRYNRTVTRNYVNVSRGPYYNPDGEEDPQHDLAVASTSSGFVSGGSLDWSSRDRSSVSYTQPDIPTTDL